MRDGLISDDYIIYNDVKGPVKVFTDNLENFISSNPLKRAYTKRGLFERLKESGYELTTMSEYLKQNTDTEI